jgi:23S rRNA pseudouridine2605 synthase
MAKRPSRPAEPNAAPRLQKVLATAGFGSRRQCEELITSGRVEIDRKVVDELGTRVDSQTQELRVDGQRVAIPRLKYFALNKPVGIVSTAKDPWARTRVIDLVDDPDRMFTVGRLDKSSSGLILVTNDGDLANRLAHPRYNIAKTYRVTVVGKPSVQTLRQLRQGIHLSDGRVRAESVRMIRGHESKSVLEVVLTEGRNREIRRMLAKVGHKVQQLTRIAIGSLRLGELPVGAYRELTRDELRRLKKITEGQAKPTAKPRKRSPSVTPRTTKRGSTAARKTPRRKVSSGRPATGRGKQPRRTERAGKKK